MTLLGAFFSLFSNLGEEICSRVHTHTYTYIFIFSDLPSSYFKKAHAKAIQRKLCVCAPLKEHALLTIFFILSFLLSLFLLCAICKLRNCRRSKMCHSSSWFFAAALSSSLSFSLYAIYLFFLHLLRARVYVMRAICGNIIRTFLAFSVSFFNV